jgi:hypothetical protein
VDVFSRIFLLKFISIQSVIFRQKPFMAEVEQMGSGVGRSAKKSLPIIWDVGMSMGFRVEAPGLDSPRWV